MVVESLLFLDGELDPKDLPLLLDICREKDYEPEVKIVIRAKNRPKPVVRLYF